MFDIPKEQLKFLTEKRFTAEEMAQLFVSANVRLKGVSLRGNYAHLSDAELDSIVGDVIRQTFQTLVANE